MAKFLPIFIVAAALCILYPVNGEIISPKLLQKLESGEKSSVVISFKEGTALALKSISKITFANRSDRLNTVTSTLKTCTQISQKAVQDFLIHKSIDFDSFWISNKIIIPEIDLQNVKLLSKFQEISEIRQPLSPKILSFPEPSVNEPVVTAREDPGERVEWNVARINVPQIWNTGNRGEDIIVANIDTGVQGTHTILKDNFRGAYGWFDATVNKTLVPTDTNGHGTFTMGLLAGKNGIGVAPGAKWMACRGDFTSEEPAERTAIVCGQFILCPTDPMGQNANCSMAPHVVSNSWGLIDWKEEGATFLDEVLEAWHAGGIIPVFGIGNNGPNCSTTIYPADGTVDVISVGATGPVENLAYFSSWGPSGFNWTIKPDLSAPGDLILSSFATGDDDYFRAYGTSASCPHVAGAVALLLADNPDLTYNEIKTALISKAETSVLQTVTNQTCGGVDSTQFPNFGFGFGRLNALASLNFSQKFLPINAK